MIELLITTDDHVQRFNRLMVRQIMPTALKSVGKFGKDLQTRVRIEIRKRAKIRTGALEQSWELSPLTREGVKLFSRSVYSRMRDKGGVIRARRKPYLVFKVGGRWVRTKRVRQFGWFYVRKALKASKPRARRTIQADMRSLAFRMAQKIPTTVGGPATLRTPRG